MEAIEEYDRLIAMDAAKEAGEHLERCLKQFEAAGDWGAQITILNEMMGFYRNQGEEQKGLESVKRGSRWYRSIGWRIRPAAGRRF